MNNATINISVYFFFPQLYIIMSFGEIPKSGPARSFVKFVFSFLGKCQDVPM